MAPDQHTELVRQYLDAFNDRDRERLAGLLAEDVVEHGIHEELHGPEAVVEFLDAHFEAFPDYSGSAGAIVADGDLVAVRYTVEGTHTGEYQGVEPTGHRVEWTGIAMYRVEDDRIAEIWIEEDRLGLLEQLEVVDRPAHLRL
jgi:steroid delta-isomerase-like uncharacterized protein